MEENCEEVDEIVKDDENDIIEDNFNNSNFNEESDVVLIIRKLNCNIVLRV